MIDDATASSKSADPDPARQAAAAFLDLWEKSLARMAADGVLKLPDPKPKPDR